MEETSGSTNTLGPLLLGAGLVLAIAVVGLTALAIFSFDSLPLLEFASDRMGTGRNFIDAVIGSRSIRVRVTSNMGMVFAITLYAWLLFALATVSRAFIQGGVRLMGPRD